LEAIESLSGSFLNGSAAKAHAEFDRCSAESADSSASRLRSSEDSLENYAPEQARTPSGALATRWKAVTMCTALNWAS